MKLQMFSIYDEKAKTYIPPFFLHNEAMAIRSFTDCVNDATHAFARHPSDYTLFHIAEFDDSCAVIDSTITPRALGNGLHFVRDRPLALAADPADRDNTIAEGTNS